jgi:hypothetical protein
MPPAGFELTISVGERPQTYVLRPLATGTDITELVDGNLVALITPTSHWFLLYKENTGV